MAPSRTAAIAAPWLILTLVLNATAGDGPAAQQTRETARVPSRVFDIEYEVNANALPLESVVLWYTVDEGHTWHQYGQDEDRQSPMSFTAPEEGHFGFFLVLTNAAGPSSLPPTARNRPHFEAFVDYTPPVVQVHEPRVSRVLGQPVLQIKWTAIDPHLDARPVELAYRRPPADAWQPISPTPLANTGRYDWRLPANLTGPVVVRVSVTDRGGHRVQADSKVFEVPAATAAADAAKLAEPVRATMPGQVVESDRARAEVLLEEARELDRRGDYREGVAKLRRAVSLDPQFTEAFITMASLLYRLEDYDRSLDAYRIAIKQNPDSRAARRGAAMVYRKQHNYLSAEALLAEILDENPRDAEVALNLGDVAILRGDAIKARECYEKAATVNPEATRVVADARKRLQFMDEANRAYTPR